MSRPDLRFAAKPQLTGCRADADYRLWLSFDDGVEGSVCLARVLGIDLDAEVLYYCAKAESFVRRLEAEAA